MIKAPSAVDPGGFLPLFSYAPRTWGRASGRVPLYPGGGSVPSRGLSREFLGVAGSIAVVYRFTPGQTLTAYNIWCAPLQHLGCSIAAISNFSTRCGCSSLSRCTALLRIVPRRPETRLRVKKVSVRLPRAFARHGFQVAFGVAGRRLRCAGASAAY